MNDIDRSNVESELSNKHGEKVDICGFYDGMNKQDKSRIVDMVDKAVNDLKPNTAEIDHIQIRFDEWSLPKMTIWTKKGLEIEENKVIEESGFVNGKRFNFKVDTRPF